MGDLVKLAAVFAFISATCAVVAPSVAEAQIMPSSDGMFLCPAPVTAGRFWNDLSSAASSGVKLTRTIGADIAKKNGCRFFASKQLKPVRFIAGQLGLSDGAALGWAAPELYINYINSPPPPSR